MCWVFVFVSTIAVLCLYMLMCYVNKHKCRLNKVPTIESMDYRLNLVWINLQFFIAGMNWKLV